MSNVLYDPDAAVWQSIVREALKNLDEEENR